MKLDNRVKALEKTTGVKELCKVVYKAGQGPDDPVSMPLEKALQEARTGHVKDIHFPLTFNEQEAQFRYARDSFESIVHDTVNRIRRDEGQPITCDNLVLCSKPVIYARQSPPQGRCGGYFVTDDGEIFHQTTFKELMERRGAGFIIVLDYDETKEPWWRASHK